jgi:hypothetical protein
MQGQLPRRDQQLQDEHTRQKSNEQLKQAFDEQSSVLGPWLEGQLGLVLSASMTNDNLESAITQLRLIQSNVIYRNFY